MIVTLNMRNVYERKYVKILKQFSIAGEEKKYFKKNYHFIIYRVNAILTPTTPSGPYGLQDTADPVMLYLNDVMTIPSNLAGLPAISLPINLSKDALPLSLQLIGQHCGEQSILEIG